MKKVAAAVVYYNPSGENVNNALSLLEQIEKLYIIDNSDSDNREIIDARLGRFKSKIEYQRNSSNLGIARALNQAAELATRDGFSLLLTLDQDTAIPTGAVGLMQAVLEQKRGEKVALVAVQPIWDREISLAESRVPELDEAQLSYPPLVINSGSLVDLETHRKVGGYRDDFFMDEVDHEYCLRLIKNGFKIGRIDNLIIPHRLGRFKLHRFLWFKGIRVTHHNPQRRFYITRNRLYLIREYKTHFPQLMKLYQKETVKDFFKMVIYERNRSKKIWNTVRGVIFFLRNK